MFSDANFFRIFHVHIETVRIRNVCTSKIANHPISVLVSRSLLRTQTTNGSGSILTTRGSL